MSTLFNPKLLKREIDRYTFPKRDILQKHFKIIQGWQKALRDHDLDKTKEKTIQGQFLEKIFHQILGYETQTEGNSQWFMIQHPKTEVDAKEADGSLGFFTTTEKTTRAVIELKDARSPLDKKQTSRKELYTPVEQGYIYATKFDHCDWIIVSNFREIRLYHKSRTSDFYEGIDFLELDRPEVYQKFYFLFNKDTLIDEKRNAMLDQLVQDTSHEEEKITQKFYQSYKQIRLTLFEHLKTHNTTVEKDILIEKAQKLLDRMIFIFFCEDRIDMLPANISQSTCERAKNSYSPSDERIWNEFKGLFLSIDKGNNRVKPPINAYNGGLFAEDTVLDALHVKDDIWDDIIALSAYDFESDVNVNILGHIFEQSISDIEQLKAADDGLKEKRSKRKTHGIFYTPENITEYIVEQTVGRYLQEHPDRLQTIKILDPACGSGAFLNQAHSFLQKQWKIAHEEGRIRSEDAHLGGLFDYNPAVNNKRILLNNIFGVDLNKESVEITKLALWLKTANKKEKLQSLNENIKCGNSLIDDPAIDKMAFNWTREFKPVLDGGGFDIVIGNPPYVRHEYIPEAQKEYLVNTCPDVSSGSADLFVYFFEKGISLLKERGYFGFIVSNKFLKADYGKKLLTYIQTQTRIVQLIDFGDLQLFENATTYPCIIILKKQKQASSTFNVLPLSKYYREPVFTNLNVEMAEKSFECVVKKDDKRWVLENPVEKAILAKMNANGVPLGQYCDGKIYYGIKTGLNEAFIIDGERRKELIAKDPRSAEIIKPLLTGKEIKRYGIEWFGKYLLLTKNGLDIPTQYPTVYEHLERYQEQLKKRYDKGENWYNLRSCNYYDEFEENKIIWGNLARRASFSYDENQFYVTNPSTIMPIEKNILPVLNSKLITFFMKKIAIERNGGYFEQQPLIVKQIPIIKPTDTKLVFLATTIEKDLLSISETKHNAIELIQTVFNPKKITKKLSHFEQLGWNDFYAEMDKNCKGKDKLTLSKAGELQTFFKRERDSILALEEAIQKAETQIDELVYDLYGLNEKEKQIIRSLNT